MRKKALSQNFVSSVIRQFTVFICEFVTAQLILRSFGSEVNGVLSSIKQFLGIIALIDGGIGGVTRAVLYKPLAEKNMRQISEIYTITERFLKKIAYIFLVYIIILALLFRQISNTTLDWTTTFVLVLSVSAGTFAEYYIGLTASLIMNANQQFYAVNIVNMLAYIFSASITIISIKNGAGIVAVKILAIIPFIIKPLICNLYVKREFKIEKVTTINHEILKQRWDGFAHQIVFYINKYVDIILLTLFKDPLEVSVYAVYSMVVNAIRSIIETLPASIEAILGDMLVRKEHECLQKVFGIYELVIGFISIVLFSTMWCLCIPFVKLYTRGVTDVEYVRPVFLHILCMLGISLCLRLPYEGIVKIAGHYKETKKGAFIEAAINIALSFALITKWSMAGITLATLISTVIRTVQYAWYLNNNILNRKFKIFIKRQIVNLFNFTVNFIIGYFLFDYMATLTIYQWVIKGFIVLMIYSMVSGLTNVIFYRNYIMTLLVALKKKFT